MKKLLLQVSKPLEGAGAGKKFGIDDPANCWLYLHGHSSFAGGSPAPGGVSLGMVDAGTEWT